MIRNQLFLGHGSQPSSGRSFIFSRYLQLRLQLWSRMHVRPRILGRNLESCPSGLMFLSTLIMPLWAKAPHSRQQASLGKTSILQSIRASSGRASTLTSTRPHWVQLPYPSRFGPHQAESPHSWQPGLIEQHSILKSTKPHYAEPEYRR